jgi:hypothetical protein
MALKAIQFHCSISMATLAESFIAAEYAVSLRAGMTFNALSQAVLLTTYAFAHGFITLVLEQIHMGFAH